MNEMQIRNLFQLLRDAWKNTQVEGGDPSAEKKVEIIVMDLLEGAFVDLSHTADALEEISTELKKQTESIRILGMV